MTWKSTLASKPLTQTSSNIRAYDSYLFLQCLWLNSNQTSKSWSQSSNEIFKLISCNLTQTPKVMTHNSTDFKPYDSIRFRHQRQQHSTLNSMHMTFNSNETSKITTRNSTMTSKLTILNLVTTSNLRLAARLGCWSHKPTLTFICMTCTFTLYPRRLTCNSTWTSVLITCSSTQIVACNAILTSWLETQCGIHSSGVWGVGFDLES